MRELYSHNAEVSVNAILILEPSRRDQCDLLPEQFFDRRNAQVYRLLLAQIDSLPAGGAVCVATLAHDAQVDLDWLVKNVRNTLNGENLAGHVARIKQYAHERTLFDQAQAIQDALLDDGINHDPLGAAEALVSELTQQAAGEAAGLVSITDVTRRYVERLDERHNNPGIHGLTTGLADLDARYMGWNPGDLIILAARPGMGKTTMATALAQHAAIGREELALIFSLEMPGEQLAQRMIASLGHIPLKMLKDTTALDHYDYAQKIQVAVHKMVKKPLAIDDTGGLDINDLCRRARQAHRREPVKLILVDYLQLVDDRTQKDRFQVVSAVSRKLKALAKELGCVVVALSQLSRKCEERPNKRPINSDLRESGQIEQDADMIIFLYRDEVYDEDSPHKGIMEVICSKFRDGEPGTDYVAFIGAENRLCNLEFRPQEQA